MRQARLWNYEYRQARLWTFEYRDRKGLNIEQSNMNLVIFRIGPKLAELKQK